MRAGRLVALALLLAMGGAAAHFIQARADRGNPPAMVLPPEQADGIEVFKARREMVLLRDGQPIARYGIALGANPVGPKLQEGDERTPEGHYRIDWRNENSIAHLSLHISYPDAADQARAAAAGVAPGGNIMIHGLPNGWGVWGRWLHRYVDWTDGCIAVTNAEMDEIWAHVPNGTPIVIHP